jgi:hypothetical protein
MSDIQHVGKRTKVLSIHVLSGCLALLGFGCASVQAPTAEGQALQTLALHDSVPLASGACPLVSAGQSISLDWNPGFNHPDEVAGLSTFRLSFGILMEDGVTVKTRLPLVLGARGVGFSATDSGNGYFHIELPISRSVAPGEYHLIAAEAAAATFEGYQGPAMEMTNSPVKAKLCFTVAGSGT